MSDILQKLLSVEQEVAKLINNTELEAQKRLSKARSNARLKANELVQNKVIELENIKKLEKERLLKENDKNNKEYLEELKKIPILKEQFKKKVLEFLKKM